MNLLSQPLISGSHLVSKTSFDGISCYLARPNGKGPWPGLIVIHEWWGLDQQTKSIADRFAAVNYLTFSPDLYHGELAKTGDAEKAMALVQKYGPTAPEELQKLFDVLKNSLNQPASWGVSDFVSAVGCLSCLG